jgi:hypothetical protein
MPCRVWETARNTRQIGIVAVLRIRTPKTWVRRSVTTAVSPETCSRQARDRQLADLHAHAVRQAQFCHGFARWAQFAHQRQRLPTALGDALALRTPPVPPEPEITDEPGPLSASPTSIFKRGARSRVAGGEGSCYGLIEDCPFVVALGN